MKQKFYCGLHKNIDFFGISCYWCKECRPPKNQQIDSRICVYQQSIDEEPKTKQLRTEDLPKPNPLVVLLRIAQQLKEIDAEFEIKADGIIMKSRKKED